MVTELVRLWAPPLTELPRTTAGAAVGTAGVMLGRPFTAGMGALPF